MPENVRLQNLRDFTVQIRDPETKEIKGTGIVISSDRIITSAHVVEAVLGVDPKEAADRKIGVYFPLISSTETKTRHAIVAGCPAQHDDDIVTLRLIDGPAPLGPEQIAELGAAGHSEGHAFLSYGYSPTLEYPATRADGRIMGSVEPPAGKILRADPIQISSQQIDHGMSGAAVLDTKLNLVVGLVAARYFPKTWAKGDIAYAVDAKVLTFDPFCFKLREEALPLRPAPVIRIDVSKATAPARKELDPAWNNAPNPIDEWVGREDLLRAITCEWVDSKKHVTGLIGFGGEGKTSLARQWVDDLIKDKSKPQPDGVFWWGFYERPSVDEFFEQALNYLSGGQIDPNKYPSSNAKAHLLAIMLYAGRYLFVLDGLEVLQNQEDDLYGMLNSANLREFLHFFSAPDHQSFCLITSRAPLQDLMGYITYTHHDVDRLSPAEGRTLLQYLGVVGSNDQLDRIVKEWDGHALTLSLLASYLKDHYGGDITQIQNIRSPIEDEPLYVRVHRVLRRYSENLTKAEIVFLKLFSGFRTPVDMEALYRGFMAGPKEIPCVLDHLLDRKFEDVNGPFDALNKADFDAMISHLVMYRIIRSLPKDGIYSIHPLIRAYYYNLLTSSDRTQMQKRAVHRLIKNYYLAVSGNVQKEPTIEDLKPLIEAVYHACCSGEYDEAFQIHEEFIQQHEKYALTYNLGAFDTELEIMLDFFPDRKTSGEPLVKNPKHKLSILIGVALSLMTVGRLDEVETFYNRALEIALKMDDELVRVSIIYRHLAELYLHLGALDKSIDAAENALKYAKEAGEKKKEINSLATRAWAFLLRGDLISADECFNKAEELEQEIRKFSYLFYPHGIWRPMYFKYRQDLLTTRIVAEANLKIAEREDWPDDISRCHHILGDLDAEIGQYETATKHYGLSVKIARSTSYRYVLIEALLARGRYFACHVEYNSLAFPDLYEALEYSASGGFRIYEADIRNALAWANLSVGNITAARDQVNFAKQMSEKMGYHWGKKDAEKVLAEIEKT